MIGGLANFVLETATSPGTGAFILNGPETGRRPFSAAFRSGQAVFYFADDGSNAEWGLGTLTIGTPSTLARTTILGTTSGAMQALNFTGTVEVYNEIPAERMPILDESGDLTILNGHQFSTVGLYTEVSGGVYDTNLIKGTAPNGTIYQIVLREYAGSHYSMLHYIYDGTNFHIYEMPQTPYNGGRLICPAGTGAVLSDLAKYQPAGDYATAQSLAAEAQTRAGADGTLQTNINNEAATRINADNALQTNIATETQARIAADNALNSTKANVAGGNNLTGPQAITDGNQFTTTGRYSEVTGNTYDTDLIKGTSPNGTIFQIAMREYAGSHYSMLHYIFDGTNFSIYEMPQTAYNGGRLQCPAGTGAVLSDLPFSDPNLKMQIFSASVAKSGGQARVNFPTAFKAGTVPFVFMTSTRSLNRGYACIPMFQDDASGNPLIDNQGFTIYTTTGSGDNNDAQYTQYLAIGYF
ncbi:MAG: hypothetical protein ABF976_10260 [Acetobacter syzygii]|uniref:hypothetical protein n=1 Tax=Acetobacter syzygii TaxID=146476 RepID=UPI0039E9AD58